MFFSTPIFTALFITKPKNSAISTYEKPIVDQSKKRDNILHFLREHKNKEYTYADLMSMFNEDSFAVMSGIMTALQRKGQIQTKNRNNVKYFSYKKD